ncbi:MAG: FxsA family protein [Gemmatimonadota bacterium]|nr:FxsA family protein [Gemmatimonadota bacterium]
MGRLVLLFIALPLLELVLLLQIGARIGAWPTVALVVTTGILGATLARSQGLRVVSAVQRRLAVGEVPGSELMDGLAVLVGGAFLLTPGILTDFLGFSLLLPFTRNILKRRIEARLAQGLREGAVRVQVLNAEGEVVEGVAEVGRWREDGDQLGTR